MNEAQPRDGDNEAKSWRAYDWHVHAQRLYRPVDDSSDAVALMLAINQAYEYAARLAQQVRARCYPEVPHWRPSPTLLEVLTQIDNMLSDMERKKKQP